MSAKGCYICEHKGQEEWCHGCLQGYTHFKKAIPVPKGWYKNESGALCPYDECAGGPKGNTSNGCYPYYHPDRKELILSSAPSYGASGYITLKCGSVEEAERIIGQIVKMSVSS